MCAHGYVLWWCRLRLDRDRKDLRRSQTALNSCLNRCPILRYLFGVVLLLLTLLVFEAVAITAIDVTNHNTGLQRGFVMTEGSLKDFNVLNTILSLSCEAGTGTFGDIYLTAVRFAGPGILTLHIVCWCATTPATHSAFPSPVMLTLVCTDTRCHAVTWHVSLQRQHDLWHVHNRAVPKLQNQAAPNLAAVTAGSRVRCRVHALWRCTHSSCYGTAIL